MGNDFSSYHKELQDQERRPPPQKKTRARRGNRHPALRCRRWDGQFLASLGYAEPFSKTKKVVIEPVSVLGWNREARPALSATLNAWSLKASMVGPMWFHCGL